MNYAQNLRRAERRRKRAQKRAANRARTFRKQRTTRVPAPYMDRETRKKLEAMSLITFGVKSRYKRMLTTPAFVKVPGPIKKYSAIYPTIENVIQAMEEIQNAKSLQYDGRGVQGADRIDTTKQKGAGDETSGDQA